MTAAPRGALGMSGRGRETAPSRTEKRHRRRRDGSALPTPNSEEAIKVSDAEMAALNIQTDDFHGEWNYTFAPKRPDG